MKKTKLPQQQQQHIFQCGVFLMHLFWGQNLKFWAHTTCLQAQIEYGDQAANLTWLKLFALWRLGRFSVRSRDLSRSASLVWYGCYMCAFGHGWTWSYCTVKIEHEVIFECLKIKWYIILIQWKYLKMTEDVVTSHGVPRVDCTNLVRNVKI